MTTASKVAELIPPAVRGAAWRDGVETLFVGHAAQLGVLTDEQQHLLAAQSALHARLVEAEKRIEVLSGLVLQLQADRARLEALATESQMMAGRARVHVEEVARAVRSTVGVARRRGGL